MPASTLLVTVRGSFKTINLELPGIDLELPGDVPVGELLPLLLEICSSQEYDVTKVLQAPISLQVEGMRTPLSLEKTLIDADVCDGAVLVLQENHALAAPTERYVPLNSRYKG